MKPLCVVVAFVLLVASALFLSPVVQATETAKTEPHGWVLPTIGFGRGDWDTSVSFFVWTDMLKARNLQWRGDLDLGPGFRAHAILRSNRELESLDGFDPNLDEGYLEGYAFYHDSAGVLSASLRVGEVRYLRFPYPDAIALFDQVPGISDLTTGKDTGYRGELLVLDYAHRSGLGAHFTGLRPDFGADGDTKAIEAYASVCRDIGRFHLEGRAGRLAVRTEPLGQGAPGYNVFAGTKMGSLHVGVLYEKLKDQPAYTGIQVTFPSNSVSQALGKYAFDYDRTPEGISMQVTFAHGRFGEFASTAPEGGTLVGEVTAERIRTYWQNGQVRNYYEHYLSAWGETTGLDLVVVEDKEPWYLQVESLVSPHTSFGSWEDLKAWERDRQGPAQISQRVVYRFYRVK